jgi:hypothetical protein
MVTTRRAAQSQRAQLFKPETVGEIIEPSASSQRIAVGEFFFKVTCACKNSERFKHSLVMTSLLFGIPACLLLRQGTLFLGGLQTALTASSILYHATHNSAVRALDVLLVFVIGTVSTAQVLAIIATEALPLVHPFRFALATIAMLVAIESCPSLFWDGGAIKLEWHVGVHLLTTAGLTLVAAGYGIV